MMRELALLAVACACWVAPAYAGLSQSCSLSITGEIIHNQSDAQGNPRHNPDGTFYPGDAYTYLFAWRFSDGCHGPQVLGVKNHTAILNVTPENERGRAVDPRGAISGSAEILPSETLRCMGGHRGGDMRWPVPRDHRFDCGHVSLAITACEHRKRGETIVCVPRYKTARVTPEIIPPIIEIGLYERVLYDRDGYRAINDDMSNYPWDPIPIEHRPGFKFHRERAGTIHFEYQTSHGLTETAGVDTNHTARHTLRYDGPYPYGFADHPIQLHNGWGMRVYSTPHTGTHIIHYSVTVWNENATIGGWHNSTIQEVVPYSPVYSAYPYPVLDDGHRYAYDDRQAVAVRYSGSMDDGAIHPDRRSKINGYAQDTAITSNLDGSKVSVGPDLMRWDSVSPIRDAPDPPVSLGEHLVFYGEGYGVLRFDQRISDLVFPDTDALYDNATTDMNLTSVMFAGYDSHTVASYHYQYPHAPLARWFNITAYMPDGTRADMPLSLDVRPLDAAYDRHTIGAAGPRLRVTVPLDEYMAAKTIHDTGEPHFAAAVLSDLYGMENTARGTGQISVWQNKTGLEFFPLFAGPANSTILDIGLYQALASPSSHRYEMAAGARTKALSAYADFEQHHTEVVNTGVNPLNVTRVGNGTVVLLSTAPHFGEADVLSVTNMDAAGGFGLSCSGGCPVSIPHAANITITNTWGGTAVGGVGDPVQQAPAQQNADALPYVLFVCAAAAAAYMVFLTARAAIRAAA